MPSPNINFVGGPVAANTAPLDVLLPLCVAGGIAVPPVGVGVTVGVAAEVTVTVIVGEVEGWNPLPPR